MLFYLLVCFALKSARASKESPATIAAPTPANSGTAIGSFGPDEVVTPVLSVHDWDEVRVWLEASELVLSVNCCEVAVELVPPRSF
jgi:hypothetical protein